MGSAADASKDATFYLLDVSMKASLGLAKEVLRHQLSNKVLFHRQDVVGLALLGTEDTNNPLNEEMGDGQLRVKILKSSMRKRKT